MIPIAVAMTLLARPMVDVAFAGGLFDAQSAAYTSRALMFYAPGLIPFSLYKVLVPAFYALKDTRTPVRIGASMVGLNIVLNIAFILTWPAGWEHAGLACATSLSSLLNVTILGVLLLRRIPGLRWRETAAVLVSIAAVAGVMAGCIAAVQPTVARVAAHLGMPEKLRQVLVLGITCAAGLAVYAAGAWMLCRDALLSALRPHSTASPLRADTI
jgi:putative peptidoglycan lipid II flippase